MMHMKRMVMIVVFIVAAAILAYGVKRYFSENQDDVKIQNFCLGLCGQDKNGKGFGIGIGASDRGPLIGAGPYDNYRNVDSE